MTWGRTGSILLVVLALVVTRTQGQDREGPEVARDQVEKLLARAAAAKTDREREAARKELRDLGEKAVPHLKSIIERGSHAEKVLAAIERSKLPAVENKTLRARAELTVHSAGYGPTGKTPPIFQLWMEVENLTGEKVALSKPSIASADGEFRVGRWYEEERQGQEWDGVLKPREKKAIYVIGEAGDKVTAGKELAAKVSLDSLKLELKTTVKKGLMVRCPCGCDRSEQMVAELRKQGGSAALVGIEKALASIAEREQVRYVTEQMLSHRLRLLRLAEEVQSRGR